MFTKIVQFVESLQRPELLKTRNGEYLYSDSTKEYSRVPLTARDREICNVDSLSRAIIETARRVNNATGDLMTVVFNDAGAEFYPDEKLLDFEQNKWQFKRRYTRLWNTIECLVGESFTHRDLLRQLESVKDCVIDFENLYTTLSKLKVSKKVNFTSQPMYEEGENSGSYSWNQRVDSSGVNQSASCPSLIAFKGKIVRGSETAYAFELSLTPVLNEEKGSIDFIIEMPGFDMVLDQVREDEYSKFCDNVKALSDLLILRDY